MAQSAFAARKAANLNGSRDQSREASRNPGPTQSIDISSEDTPGNGQIARKKRRRLQIGSAQVPKTLQDGDSHGSHTGAGQTNGLKHKSPVPQTEMDSTVEYTTPEPIFREYQNMNQAPDGGFALEASIHSHYDTSTWSEAYNSVDITLRAGDAVSIIGEYDLWVKKGSIRLLGATIHASSKSFRVQTPTTHAIPSIEALSNPFRPSSQNIEIHISSCASGLCRLRRCELKFARIWHKNVGSLASFEVLNGSYSSSITPLEIPRDWQIHTSRLVDHKIPPIVMICGPKNTGKSTFARFLSNSLLSKRAADTGIGFLDLDPGQPEYAPPADLSLAHIKTFNLGPSFTHPTFGQGQENVILRQHHYGHLSPRYAIEHYLDCAIDLHQHFERFLKDANCPLVINTCGWVQGLGMGLLESLVKRIKPSHVVCFTAPEMDDTIRMLGVCPTELLIMSPRSLAATPKFAADLRTMQQCSYFHLGGPENGNFHWNAEPILQSQPLKLSYAGENKIISALLLLGGHINYEMLEEAVNRTILALVAIEDASVISNSLMSLRLEISEDTDGRAGAVDVLDNVEIPGGVEFRTYELESHNDGLIEEYALRSKSDGLPILSTTEFNNPPLDPSKTRSLGQVILDGIDTEQQIVRLHTPIHPSTIKACVDQGLSLILVRGQLGTPESLYLEEFVQAKAVQEDIADLRALEQDTSAGEDMFFDTIVMADRKPFVEYQGNRNRSKVRRVRRNLGTK